MVEVSHLQLLDFFEFDIHQRTFHRQEVAAEERRHCDVFHENLSAFLSIVEVYPVLPSKNRIVWKVFQGVIFLLETWLF